jgi:Trp operon repressor
MDSPTKRQFIEGLQNVFDGDIAQKCAQLLIREDEPLALEVREQVVYQVLLKKFSNPPAVEKLNGQADSKQIFFTHI